MSRHFTAPCIAIVATLLATSAQVGCQGVIGDPPRDAPEVVTAPPPAEDAPVAPSGMRRLTVAELDRTVADLLFIDDVTAVLVMPEDRRNPFDNDATTQTVSQALVEGSELHFSDLWNALVADSEKLSRVVGCEPSSATDAACMRSFVETFGRRALRRPLAPEEIDMFVNGPAGGDGALAIAEAGDDFYGGVGFIVKALLQDPEFLFRIEIGEPAGGGVFRLGPFELASRLSYLLWGSMPDDELLDRAAAGELSTDDDLRREAQRLLRDSRAVDHVARFHGLWLGYEQNVLPGSEMTDAMLAESRALVERVLFDEARPWQELFTFPETYVSAPLAEHYGLDAPPTGTSDWVAYGTTTPRAGILSHGTFLALGRAFGDTSPVQRGIAVKERLLCQTILPPPPTVNVDARPESDVGFCKTDRYAAHGTGGCASCHAQIDPVGFGLESFDLAGRFRTNEPDNPTTPEDESTCIVASEGAIVGVGDFSGPAELGVLGTESGMIQDCLIQQLYRFAAGRFALDSSDAQIVDQLRDRMGSDFALEPLLVEMVTQEWFRYRREPSADGDER